MNSAWPGKIVAQIDALLALAVILLADSMLVHSAKTAEASKSVQPGSVLIQLYWDPSADADIDLWVKAPDTGPVGFSNKTLGSLALMRDDMGRGHTADSRNYELTVGSGLHAGEYICNAEFYSTWDNRMPVHVRLTAQVFGPHGPVDVGEATGALSAPGAEITLLRFRLDDKGDVVPGSLNALPYPLARARQ